MGRLLSGKLKVGVIGGLLVTAAAVGLWAVSADTSNGQTTPDDVPAMRSGAAPYLPGARVIGGPLPESVVQDLMRQAASNGGEVQGHAILNTVP